MKILSAGEIRQWDAFTIIHEPVTSIDLMERAAAKCLQWLEKNHYLPGAFAIYCGKGNNGGDGLALARMLSSRQSRVTVYILESGRMGTDDFQTNLSRLHRSNVPIIYIHPGSSHYPVPPGAVIIDALFGTGLNRPPDAAATSFIETVNRLNNEVIAIDIPSGMFTDTGSEGGAIIKATHTLTFQCYKLAFLLPENAPWFGKLHVLDIGLSPAFLETVAPDLEMLDSNIVKAIYRPRQSFAHKGTYGHSLTIAGSYGKMGAAVLSAKACLRTGSGLHTCMAPGCGYVIMQISVPEAMVIPDANDRLVASITEELHKYQAIGIGPGLGTAPETAAVLHQVISGYTKPLVIDADALNMLAANVNWITELAPFSILTPHPKEFERLCGPAANDYERLQLARAKAREWQVIIVLKGHNTFIALPGGKGYFNTTGNPGMATGGSGDVLTGIITSLLAQQYTPEQAALLGVYLHGLAGDMAAAVVTEESLIASDIIKGLSNAFKQVSAAHANG